LKYTGGSPEPIPTAWQNKSQLKKWILEFRLFRQYYEAKREERSNKTS